MHEIFDVIAIVFYMVIITNQKINVDEAMFAKKKNNALLHDAAGILTNDYCTKHHRFVS